MLGRTEDIALPIEITMPRLSDTMERGTVVKWNVKEGDTVAAGDVLADIETDKATMELESFDDGTVARIAIPEGESIGIGEVIMILAEEDEDVEAAGASAGASADSSADPSAIASVATTNPTTQTPGGPVSAVSVPPADAAGSSTTRGVNGEGERVFASPLARKLAFSSGVNLADVRGTGPSGRIVKKDVEAAMSRAGASVPTARMGDAAPEPSDAASAVEAAVSTAAPTPEPTRTAPGGLESRTVPMSTMRSIIARRLVESKTTIPHYQVTVEADVGALLELRAQLNDQLASQGVKLTVNDFIVRACALAMHEHPFVNSRWVEAGAGAGAGGGGGGQQASIEILGSVNVGVAIALPEERGGGLVVATLRDADRMGLRQISSETKALARKAREKGLAIDEMGDSTFTISNLGMFGVSHFTAIINPPNVCILAVGAAEKRPVVRDGQLAVGTLMSMTMSSDHRVVDGAMAAQYLQSVKRSLESPATLLV
ncbi:2-oxo acid dehydrogenase subunit E2 [Roseiflexus sp. AH-315-K22]|nr:2-oxo acid dehydrogenase subunit E2 [Roseiflexus sp. AH-315-K22]